MASPAPSSSLTGVLERIIFFNEENHYTIAELKPDKKPAEAANNETDRITIVGPLPGAQCGETLQLTGEWTRHVQHGAQFKVVSFKSELPSSVYGIRKYLGSGLVPGIGKVYANKIVDAFGTDTFRILSEESGKLRKVEGIGKMRATAIKEAWEEQKVLREVHIFLQTYGVTTSQCVKLVNKYGPEAKQVVIKEPYRVAREIDGIGFKTADKIAINLGYANDAPPRLDAGLIYALETLQEEGHTAFPLEDLITHAATMLETSAEFITARITALVEKKDLICHDGRARPPGGPDEPTPTNGLPGSSAKALATGGGQDLPKNSVIQLPNNDRAEQKIAASVKRLDAVPSGLPAIKIDAAVTWAQDKAGFAFHEFQAAAIKKALAHKFSILTGGPGTGKTTILRALVEILKAKKVRVTLAAPTGRAAQRLSATTGGFASTIHRLLKFENGGFTVNESKPLATDFLIVDETSMLDTRLAAALLQAVPVRAHLLLVGDIDQLPSVGAGNVLKDLIAVSDAQTSNSGTANVTRLSFVYRQKEESLIVTTAHAINGGEPRPPPIVDAVEKAQAWSDLNFISATSAEDCLAKIVELTTKFIPQHYKWFHPINDVQILAPMHKGIAGVGNLNTQLQAAVNSHQKGLRAVSGEYRPGDKLIQLRNNYDKNLFNGDIGTVKSVDLTKGTLIASFDGENKLFERGEFGEVALAYAISIHKSQGSEYPVVIVPLLKAHFMMLQRNLIYTAITRGRKKVFIVGEVAAYGMAVRNAESKSRHTHLKEKILSDAPPA
ncbi:SF1B family DNA helicase RecD2 [Oleiharenicola lentus]|uniref:SF1B family DNA helicase RecD2 n=1 Tax=Oleiharenicola lentus TaxID=2508720 RepID=UPI003F67B50B